MSLSFKQTRRLGIGILLGTFLVFAVIAAIALQEVAHDLRRSVQDHEKEEGFLRATLSFESLHAEFYKCQDTEEFDADRIIGKHGAAIRQLLGQVLEASPSPDERRAAEHLLRNEARLRTAVYAYAASRMEHPTTDNRPLLRQHLSVVVESSVADAMQTADRIAGALCESREAQVRTMINASRMFAVAGGLTLLTGIGVSLFITRALLRQVRQMLSSTRQLKQGNLDYRINSPHRDALGQLAGEIDSLAESLHESIRAYQDELAERKRIEGELKQAQERLEQRVAERTRELLEANERIRQAQADLVQSEKMGMLGQLVAGVAHEINTPTGAIMNVATDAMDHLRELPAAAMRVLELPTEIRRWLAETVPHVLAQETVVSEIADRQGRRNLERELRRQGVADSRRMAEILAACGLTAADPLAVRSVAEEPVQVFLEHLTALKASSEICHASVRKIALIVKALRYYSRSGEGEQFDVDLNESIDNTLVILQNRIKHIAQVERRYQDSLPTVRCGADISQVWTNVLSNACDAIENSRSQAKMGRIRIATRAEGDGVVVEIFNEGPPIPQDLLPRIFDPFFTTKPIGKGTGLGLSICTGILRKYDGRITARNEAGGVAFRIALPAARRRADGTGRPGEAGTDQAASRGGGP